MENQSGHSFLQAVCQKFSDGVEIIKCVSGFIKEVGETELCYSSCLEKLVKSPFYNFHSNFMTQFLGSTPYQELGTVKHTWEKLGEELNILARLHAEKAVAYQDSVRKPLIELMPLLEEKRKEFRNKAKQLKADLDAAEAKHLKERALYHKMADSMDQSQAKGESGPKALLALMNIGKREVKIEGLKIQEVMYRQAHDKHLEATKKFKEGAIILLENMLEMESTRVDTVKNCLKGFTTILSNTAPTYSGVMQRLTDSVEQISAVKDVRVFVKHRQQIENKEALTVPELELRQNSDTGPYPDLRPVVSTRAVRMQNRSSHSAATVLPSTAMGIKVPHKTPSTQTMSSHSEAVKPKCSSASLYPNLDAAKPKYSSASLDPHSDRVHSDTVRPKGSSTSLDLASTIKITSDVVRCNPLVVDNVINDVSKHFHWSRFKDDIVIEAPEVLVAHIKDVFTKIISKNESQIKIRKKSLGFHYYPLLMSTIVRDQLSQIIDHRLEFKVEHHGKVFSLTELQNISSSSRESCHQWFWFDGHTFVAYDSQVNEQIESAFMANRPTLQVSIRSQSYLIDISKSKQVNMRTKNSRDIQRRLTSSRKNFNIKLHLTSHKDYISLWEDGIMNLLQSFIVEETVYLSDSIHTLGDFVKQLISLCSDNIVEAVWEEESKLLCLRGCKDRVMHSKKKIQDRIIAKEKELKQISKTNVPSSWTPQTENCELKIVPRGSSEWNYVEEKFTKGFQAHIVNIERIQNKWLWNDYAHERKKMFTKNAKIKDENEKYLFHGTRSNPPKDIYNSEQGFDHRMASKGLLGEGIYFAATAKYSADGYAYTMPNGHKQVFLVRVLTGVSEERTQPDRLLKAPPKKPLDESLIHGFEGERYDSVTAFAGGSQIYVIYDQGRAYPDYLITFLKSVS